jgi:hypothetical protein
VINVAKDFEEFLREEERLNQPREQVRRIVNNYCRTTGQPYSLVWRTLYLKLEARTGYRVPDNAKSMLQTIEDVGHIDALLREAKTLA